MVAEIRADGSGRSVGGSVNVRGERFPCFTPYRAKSRSPGQLARNSAHVHAPADALFISRLIITASFLPVFALEDQEGRLVSPLAWTKTLAMAAAALLSITLVPVMMGLFIRTGVKPEAANPVNRFLVWVYRPVIAFVLHHQRAFTLLQQIHV